jgi:hypothetical protein
MICQMKSGKVLWALSGLLLAGLDLKKLTQSRSGIKRSRRSVDFSG